MIGWRKPFCAALVALLLTGCAAERAHRDGMGLIDRGQLAPGLEKLRLAADLEPGNTVYRQRYFLQRERVLARFMARLNSAIAERRFADADRMLVEAAAFGATAADLVEVRDRIADARADQGAVDAATGLRDAGRTGEAIAGLRRFLGRVPGAARSAALLVELERALPPDDDDATGDGVAAKTISLQLRGATLKQAFLALGDRYGIAFVFDRDVRTDDPVSISLRDVTVEAAFQALLQLNRLERRRLSAGSW